MTRQFNLGFFIACTTLLIVEINIAVFLKDGFIRYTVGDFLVTILMYCFFRSFLKTKPLYVAIATILIAYTIEFLQLISLFNTPYISNKEWLSIILGSSFSIQDLIAYTLGVALVMIIDSTKLFQHELKVNL